MDSHPRPRRQIPFPSSAPKRPRIPFSSPSESSSQAAPDLAFLNYSSRLHPISSTNRVSCSQRFSETDLPPPPPVFSLPYMDLQWESCLMTSGNIIAAKSNVNEPALDGLPWDSNTMIPSTGCQRVDGRLNNRPDVPAGEVNRLVHSGMFWDPTSAAQHRKQLGPQQAGQPQCMHRFLQFEIAGACHATKTGNSLSSWRTEINYANPRLPESLFSSQQRGIFRNQPPANPTRLSQFAPCAAYTPETLNGMAGSTHHAGNQNIFAPGNAFTSEINDMMESLNQISPRKKRKRAKHSTGNEDGRHCRCKKSRCLKLYCECFADDKHCSDSCDCSDCHNKCGNDDKLQEIRCQIQSRNPQAFDPKIVNSNSNSRQGDGNWTTLSSARHRRGCNCKKSMCQKKYCECYQAKVGCSDACRCESCQNCYGRKTEGWKEGITDINQKSPCSHPQTEARTFTALPNLGALPEVLHAPSYNSQTTAGSSNTLVPQLPENEFPPELSSAGARRALTEDGETPSTIISSPSRPPSPPHSQLNDVAR